MTDEKKPATDEYIGALMLGLHDIETGSVGAGTSQLLDSLHSLVARIRADRKHILELEADVQRWQKIALAASDVSNPNVTGTWKVFALPMRPFVIDRREP